MFYAAKTLSTTFSTGAGANIFYHSRELCFGVARKRALSFKHQFLDFKKFFAYKKIARLITKKRIS